MKDPNAKAISPADIIELIRKNTDKGFTGRDFSAAIQYSNVFSDNSITRGATRLDPEPANDVQEQEEPVVQGVSLEELDAQIAAAKEAGYAAGYADATVQLDAKNAELNASLEQARNTFLSLAHRLRDVHHDEGAALSHVIETAILALVRDRISAHIEEFPKAFSDRISDLARRITSGVEDVKIRLNPDDLGLIEEQIANNELLSEAVIKADPELGRGDVVISSGSLRIEDILTLKKPGA